MVRVDIYVRHNEEYTAVDLYGDLLLEAGEIPAVGDYTEWGRVLARAWHPVMPGSPAQKQGGLGGCVLVVDPLQAGPFSD